MEKNNILSYYPVHVYGRSKMTEIYVGRLWKNIQGESKKSGISKSMYIALRAIKIKQIKF